MHGEFEEPSVVVEEADKELVSGHTRRSLWRPYDQLGELRGFCFGNPVFEDRKPAGLNRLNRSCEIVRGHRLHAAQCTESSPREQGAVV